MVTSGSLRAVFFRQNSLVDFLDKVRECGLGINKSNLVSVNIKQNLVMMQKELSVCLKTAHSLKNKADEICDYIVDKDVDVCAVTETWLGKNDAIICGQVTPQGYKMHHVCRKSGRGGGIAIH